MAITYDSSASGSVGVNTTGTFSHTVSGSNRYMLVVTSGCDSVSYAGVSMTLLRTYVPTVSGGGTPPPPVQLWGLANPNTGTNNVSITNTSLTRGVSACSISFAGVSSTQPNALNDVDTGINLQSALSATVTSVVDNAWVVGFYTGSENIGRNFTAGSGTTLRQTVANTLSYNATGILDKGAATTPAGTVTLNVNWSSGTGRIATILYALEPYISYTFSGPSSGNVNSASTNFTVTPDQAINGTITITPSGPGSTGLSPTVLTFSNSATPQTFTITPQVAGAITLTPTNGLGLPNPAALTYTANAVVPNAPVIGTAVPGNTQAFVAFTPPAFDGGATITEYRAISTPGSFTGTGTSSPITVNGLTNGVSYTFTVRATNSAGNSAESSASNSVTPYVAATSYTLTGPTSGNVRSASTNFTVTPNAVYFGTITITPSGAGSTNLSPIVLTFNGSATPQTFTITPEESGLITLTGTNSGTLSNPAALNYTANAVVPLAPTIGSVTPQVEQIEVGVSAPTNDGGSGVLYYTVYCSNGTTKTLLAPGTVTFTELDPATSYTFYANATNSVGTSANSATTDAVSPLTEASRLYNSGPKFNVDAGGGNVLTF